MRVSAPLNADVLATLCGRMRVNRIFVLPGDRVTIEVSPYDTSRGRILARERHQQRGAA